MEFNLRIGVSYTHKHTIQDLRLINSLTLCMRVSYIKYICTCMCELTCAMIQTKKPACSNF